MTHGSTAVPEPEAGIMPDLSEMAGRMPYVVYTIALLRTPFEFKYNPCVLPCEKRSLGESNQKSEPERAKEL